MTESCVTSHDIRSDQLRPNPTLYTFELVVTPLTSNRIRFSLELMFHANFGAAQSICRKVTNVFGLTTSETDQGHLWYPVTPALISLILSKICFPQDE